MTAVGKAEAYPGNVDCLPCLRKAYDGMRDLSVIEAERAEVLEKRAKAQEARAINAEAAAWRLSQRIEGSRDVD